MYSDFFPPPREEYVRPPRGSGKEKDAKKAKSKGKGKGVSFGDDADVDMDAEEEEDVERGVMGRVKGDLFADDDEAEEAEAEKSACIPSTRSSFLTLARSFVSREASARSSCSDCSARAGYCRPQGLDFIG